MNEKIKKAIQEARKVLADEPNGRLPLFYRKKIWAAIGPRIIEDLQALRTTQLVQRIKLAELCAKKVLPIWEKDYANEKDVREFFILAQEYLNGNVLWEEVESSMDDFVTILINLESGPLRPHSAGICLSKFLLTVLRDENFENCEVLKPDYEEDREFERWDASFAASVAESGLYWWEEDGGNDPIARRKFWEWYLDVAIPDAIKAEYNKDQEESSTIDYTNYDFKEGLIAVYNNEEYRAFKLNDGTYRLISTVSSDVENGFEPKDGVFKKTVTKDEISAACRIKLTIVYQGHEFELDQNMKSFIQIIEKNHDSELRNKLKLEPITPLKYGKWINKKEIENVFKERLPVEDFPMPEGLTDE